MRLTRRGFLKGAAAGGAMLALPSLAHAKSPGSSYSVAVLGDTHFDEGLDPAAVASYDVAKSKYHCFWTREDDYNPDTHYAEFLRNGAMWHDRCPRLVAASAKLANSKPTRFILQLGDLVQGDCNNADMHAKMLKDAVAAMRGGFPSGTPFLTVLGNHDVRGLNARDAYLGFAQTFMADEIKRLTGVKPGSTKYPVFSFRLGDDLWVFCDFDPASKSSETLRRQLQDADMDSLCGVIEADRSARHVFLVTHGPFTASAVSSGVRWRLAGMASEDKRMNLYKTLSRRHAIVLSGHTHLTDFYLHENEYGGFSEMTVNSVWRRENLATAVPKHDKVGDYAVPESSPEDRKKEIAFFRPGLKSYFHNKAAGHYRLNVSDKKVTMDFYPGDATTPARTFTMWEMPCG